MNETDEQQIRDLVVRWASAVHAGDLETVLADHASDIVMFDVPPPYWGVRGMDAYRETWPPFFEWQAQGASFEITELDVTDGTDVAFAYALLRCGTRDELAADPENRLRLTLGLVKRDGRWQVQHEHHSFPLVTEPSEPTAVEEVREVHETWFERTAANDLEGLMELIGDDVVSYEHAGRLQYAGIDAVREVCRKGLESGVAGIAWEIPDLTVTVRGDLGVAWGIDHLSGHTPEGDAFETRSRGTRVFRREHGGWRLIHQHLSYPRESQGA